MKKDIYRKVYLVTSGEYSDYHVDAVFSTKEKAEEYIDVKGTDYSIEEYDVDIAIERKTVMYNVIFSELGEQEVKICYYGKPDTVHWSDSYCKKYTFTISSDSVKKAIKIASERLMQIKAMPYLFPLLKQKRDCCREFGRKDRNYPTYNYKTREIVLEEGHWIDE